MTNSQTRFSVEDHSLLPKHNRVVTFGESGHSFQAVRGPGTDGVDILVREDLRFEGEPPDILTQFAMACCPGHNQAPNLLLLALWLIDSALILTGRPDQLDRFLPTVFSITTLNMQRL